MRKRYIVLTLYIIFLMLPIYWLLNMSLKTTNEILGGFSAFPREFTLDSYRTIFTDPSWYNAYINSITYVVINTIISVVIALPAAYAFSRLRFRGRRAGLLSLIVVQMFPSLLGLVAIYGMLIEIGRTFPAFGLDTQLGLIMIYMGGSLGTGTYLMYGFFNTVPKEIDEAAKIDGATHTQIYFQIILRLVSPILAVQMLLSFIGISSDFILASIVMNKPDQYTLAVGLGLFIDQPYSKNWAMFCAGAVIAATPIVALFMGLQRYIVSGLTGGAVKG